MPLFLVAAFLLGSSAAMDNDSSRASILYIDGEMSASSGVRAAAQLVALLIAQFTKDALQRALILCVPSAWVIAWHCREFLQLEFRSLLLAKSPPLRAATAEQATFFAAVAKRGVDDTLLAVIQATCPSVVLAVFSHYGIIDSAYIATLQDATLQAAADAEFKGRKLRIRSSDLNIRFDSNDLSLRTLDAVFHDLDRGRVTKSWSKFVVSHPSTNWGAYVGIAIYKKWLSSKIDHVAALTQCYALERMRPEGRVPLTTSSSTPPSTPQEDSVFRRLTFSSGGSGSAHSKISSASRDALAVIRDGSMPTLSMAIRTDFKEVFADTYDSNNPMFHRVFAFGLTYAKVSSFLKYKADPFNPNNEAKCKQLMVLFLAATRDVAETQRNGYMVGLDSAAVSNAVQESTEKAYSLEVGVALSYLCHIGEIVLVDDVNEQEANLGRIMQGLLRLSTAANDGVMKSVAAYCCVDFKGRSVVVCENKVAAISAFLSALMLTLKRVWACKKAQLSALDFDKYGGRGQALGRVATSPSMSVEEFSDVESLNAILGGGCST